MTTLFFDIGATLADPLFEADGSLRLRPRPRAVRVLDAFSGERTGIISDPGTEQDAVARAAAALHEAFPGRFTLRGSLAGTRLSKNISAKILLEMLWSLLTSRHGQR
ncbi:hypothetical protein [Streptomyces sp. NPDC023588]|uniref:hypothetical protein n=1 Tax=Streptomyces sp. NPDC023588 TaxID=3154907 RepID=UPI0033F38107